MKEAADKILTLLVTLPDEETRKECLRTVLKGRCRQCLEISPSPYWCCYDSPRDA